MGHWFGKDWVSKFLTIGRFDHVVEAASLTGARAAGMITAMVGELKVWAVGVVAVVLGALALTGCGGGGSSSDGDGTVGSGGETSSDPISLPDEIDGYTDLVEAIEAKDGRAATIKGQKENQEVMTANTTAAYEKAFGGAAAYRAYADDELMKLPYVIAVRAEAPGMTTGPVVDPKYLGLAKPEREVQTHGDVECQIAWSPPTIAGAQPEPSSELTTNCQRSGSGVTVFVGSGGYEGPRGLKALSSFTDAAWEAAQSGSTG